MTSTRMPWICVFCALLSCEVSAASLSLRNAGLQQELVADAVDGVLDRFDPLSAGLVAGGVCNLRKLDAYREQLAELRSKQLGGQLARSSGVRRDRAALLFEFLHRQLLTGKYHVEYTALGQTLDSGHYNCVSATILYYWLCNEAGLGPVIVARPEHVYLRLPGEPPLNVETTCPQWFAQRGGGPHRPNPPAHELPTEREVSFIQLLGKVFYNRAVQALANQRFAEAIDLLEISLELDPGDSAARQNLLAGFNNWSLAEAAAGRYTAAVQLLGRGRSIEPNYGPFQVNDLHIHQEWTSTLCRQRRFAEALELLEAGYRRRGDAELFDRGRLVVCQLWIESLFREQHEQEAWRVVQVARRKHAGDLRWPEYEAAALESAAEWSQDLTTP